MVEKVPEAGYRRNSNYSFDMNLIDPALRSERTNSLLNATATEINSSQNRSNIYETVEHRNVSPDFMDVDGNVEGGFSRSPTAPPTSYSLSTVGETEFQPPDSPKTLTVREKILDLVRSNTARTRDNMVHRDAFRHPIPSYALNDNLVSILVPKKDRISTDNNRVICEIIGMNGNVYELRTEVGKLSRWFTVTELEPVPSNIHFEVQVETETHFVTLRLALRLLSRKGVSEV